MALTRRNSPSTIALPFMPEELLAALIEEPPDAYGSSPLLPHNFCPDVSASARLLPREAATPHAPLSLPKGGVLTTALGIDRPPVFDPRKRATEPWDTRLAALVERLTPIHDGAAFPRSSATGNDAETLGVRYAYVGGAAEKFSPNRS